jgi:hypothetical protein
MNLTMEIADPPGFISAMRERYERAGGAIDIGGLSDDETRALDDLTIEEKRAHKCYVTPQKALPDAGMAAQRLLVEALGEAGVYVEAATVGLARRAPTPRPHQGDRHRAAQRRRSQRGRGARRR